MTEPKNNNEPKHRTGPDPDRLKIKGGWKQAVERAVNTPPPNDDGNGDTEERDDNGNDATEALS